MDDRKDLTKALIASSMKELVLTHSFDKITIRMIAEKAGVIRPTFYYHFQDKYEVFNWIIESEILQPVALIFRRGMPDEALKLAFASVFNDREFYRRAFEISGQNAFTSIFVESVYEFIQSGEGAVVLKAEAAELMSFDVFAYRYAVDFVAMVYMWLKKWPDSKGPNEVNEIFKYFLSHSLSDMIELVDESRT